MTVIDLNSLEHDATRKPLRTFRHHALDQARRAAATGWRIGLLATALMLMPGCAVGLASAQGVDCATLQAEIDAGQSGGDSYGAALREQQYELRRMQDYSDSIGCGSGLFGGGPPQCDAIEARIERMQADMGRLRDQAQGGPDDGERRRALIERFNSACTSGPSEDRASLDGGGLMPADPGAAPDAGGDLPSPPQARVKALCVRQCDGGYFPITDDASSSTESLDHLDQLCKAMCPGTEASLYTTSSSGSIDTAVTPDGTPYTALPAAFKFQKSYDAACSCKPPHQSWVEALAGAEKLIQGDKGDVTVTQKLSDQMARPGAATVPAAKAPRRAKVARRPKAAPAGNLGDQAGIAIPPPPKDGEDLTQQFRQSVPAP